MKASNAPGTLKPILFNTEMVRAILAGKRPAPGELPRARNRPLRWATSCMCGKHGVLTPLERTTGQTGRTALARKWTATTDGTRQFTWERTLREFFCE